MSEKMNISKNKKVKLKTEENNSNGGEQTSKILNAELIEDKKTKHEEMFGEKDKKDKSNI
jgi:hypothetical protein